MRVEIDLFCSSAVRHRDDAMRGPERVHTRQAASEGRLPSVHGMFAGARRAAGGNLASRQGAASQTKNGSGRSGGETAGARVCYKFAVGGYSGGGARWRSAGAPRHWARGLSAGMNCPSAEMLCAVAWCQFVVPICGMVPTLWAKVATTIETSLEGRARAVGGCCSLFGAVVGPGINRYTSRNGSDNLPKRRKRSAPPLQWWGRPIQATLCSPS